MNNDIAVYNRDGDRTESLTVPESHLEREKGYQAVFETVQAVLANQRRGTASSKTRSEVRGGGAKPYRQKGTGRARAGSIRSPLWVGGGVTFGPKPRSYRKRVNKKVKRLALRRAFTERLDEGAVQAIEEFSFSVPSTKAVAGILKAIGAEKETVMVVLGQADATAKKSASNLGNVFITEGNKVNAYLLLKYDKVIFTKGGWENFSKRLEGSTANERSL